MRIIETIEKAMEYNELLAKIERATIWYADPTVPQQKKDDFDEKYIKVRMRWAELSNEFDELGITYKGNEAIKVIELPDSLKRKDIEGFLEDWARHKEKLKVGT